MGGPNWPQDPFKLTTVRSGIIGLKPVPIQHMEPDILINFEYGRIDAGGFDTVTHVSDKRFNSVGIRLLGASIRCDSEPVRPTFGGGGLGIGGLDDIEKVQPF